MRRWRQAITRGLGAVAAAEAVGVPRAMLCRQEAAGAMIPTAAAGAAAALDAAVEALRADNPVWGKRKLGPLLRRAGHAVSDAAVGRILPHLVRLDRAVPVPVFRRPTCAAA